MISHLNEACNYTILIQCEDKTYWTLYWDFDHKMPKLMPATIEVEPYSNEQSPC